MLQTSKSLRRWWWTWALLWLVACQGWLGPRGVDPHGDSDAAAALLPGLEGPDGASDASGTLRPSHRDGAAGGNATLDSTNVNITPETTREAGEATGRWVGVALSQWRLDDPASLEVAAREFNYVTPENEMKWESTEPRRGEYTLDAADAIVDFAERNGMRVKGHTLVWHSQLPDWVRGLSNTDEIRQVMHDHIRAVAGHYRGRVAAWDVVNEAIDDSNGHQLRDTVFRRLGDTYINEAFEIAREAAPDALLFYNDYSLEGLGGKSDAAYALVQRLLQDGVPIDGIGFQMHVQAEGWPSTADVAANFQRFSELGLLVAITELDVNVCAVAGNREQKLEVQRRRYHDIVAACAGQDRCHAVSLWGLADRQSWLSSFSPCSEGQEGQPWPLAFDDDLQRKPAWQGIMDGLLGR